MENGNGSSQDDRPTIMVTNDDGIDAPGSQAPVRVLISTDLYHVWVCAPDSLAPEVSNVMGSSLKNNSSEVAI